MKEFATAVKSFLIASYHSDKLSFFLEMINFACSSFASVVLVVTALNPNLIFVYPMFLIGSVSQAYASYRRKLIWLMLLMMFYTILNVIGCVRIIFQI
jgi:hypothetical protein